MEYLLLIVGLALILFGANFLTNGSTVIAQKLHVPEFVIGLTIVAIGTSMPELVVSVLSALKGESSVAIGNIVGSNIFNIFAIGGVCALITPIALTRNNIRRDIPFGVFTSLLLLVMTLDVAIWGAEEDSINRIDGIIMLLIYIGLMAYSIRKGYREEKARASGATPQGNVLIAVLSIAGGLAGLIYGGNLFLEEAIAIAKAWGVSESVIAITLVAGGTSLPELASSVVSVVKGHSGMALGNIIGSNIANILLILGISSTITPLAMGGITLFDIMMVLLGSVLLFVAAYTFRSRELDRVEGAIFISIYIAYLGLLIF